MAALFTTPKRNDTTAGTHVAEPDVRRRIGLAHGSWRRVTRRIVCSLACALTVSSLLMPSVSLAAEWVKVGGNKYNTAASDEAGTWSWDGADDLKLNNYNGGEIQAAGKLNVNYSGTNIVTAEWIESINVSHGTNENAEHRMASGQTAISRLTTAEPLPPGLPRTRVLEPTRTSLSRVAGRSRQAQPMVRPFGAAAISTSRTAARSRQAPRKTLPSRPRAASQPQTPPST